MAANHTQGWVESPNNRGTIDIVRSCLAPIFLCTWTVLSLNIPAKHETWFECFQRKARWWLLALMAPEILASFAAGQYARAKRSVVSFQQSGYTDWTLKHAFYANMGGFVLESADFPPFSLNAVQLHWLIENKYVSYPMITQTDIDDKSKGDRLSKVITIGQVTWFLLQAFSRPLQGLAITALEISTVAFIFCTFGTSFYWFAKPVDIQTATVLTCNTSLADILKAAGPIAAQPYKQTPLDFIEKNLPSWSISIMPLIGLQVGVREQPLPRIPNDRLPPGMGIQDRFFLWILTLIYATAHFWGWNLAFATPIERTLWRLSSIALVVATMGFWLVDTPTGYWHSGQIHQLARQYTRKMKRQTLPQTEKEPLQKRGKRYPLGEVMVCFLLGNMYAVARAYLIVEAFAELRALPETAFLTVQWTDYLPHI